MWTVHKLEVVNKGGSPISAARGRHKPEVTSAVDSSSVSVQRMFRVLCVMFAS